MLYSSMKASAYCILFSLIWLQLISSSYAMGGMVGGMAAPTEGSNQDVNKLVEDVRGDICKRLAKNDCPTFTVMSYATQVVSGTNYFVKLRYDSDKYIEVRIYEPGAWMGNAKPKLSNVRGGLTSTDPVVYI